MTFNLNFLFFHCHADVRLLPVSDYVLLRFLMDPTNGLLIFCFIYLFILASYLSVFGGNIYFLCLVTQISCILETSLRFSIALFISIHKLSHAYNAELVICSLNVRGLSKIMKRRETFHWLKMKKYAVYFQQQVHCTKDKEHIWSAEWGYSAIFSSFSSASAGCVRFLIIISTFKF